MIRATRRTLLAGALAVPTLSGLAAWRWRHGDLRVLLHDASLEVGRRFADAGAAQGLQSTAIEGDRVRFMRSVLAVGPALVAGVSRHADALLIEDIAREHGYVLAAGLDARGGRCRPGFARPGWSQLADFTGRAGADWPEALACYAARPETLAAAPMPSTGRKDRGLVLGWVLVPRA